MWRCIFDGATDMGVCHKDLIDQSKIGSPPPRAVWGIKACILSVKDLQTSKLAPVKYEANRIEPAPSHLIAALIVGSLTYLSLLCAALFSHDMRHDTSFLMFRGLEVKSRC